MKQSTQEAFLTKLDQADIIDINGTSIRYTGKDDDYGILVDVEVDNSYFFIDCNDLNTLSYDETNNSYTINKYNIKFYTLSEI